jgi:hypothetical protein
LVASSTAWRPVLPFGPSRRSGRKGRRVMAALQDLHWSTRPVLSCLVATSLRMAKVKTGSDVFFYFFPLGFSF